MWGGPFKGHRGPLKGSRGPFEGPRCPFKGPPGSFKRTPGSSLKDPRGPFKGSPGALLKGPGACLIRLRRCREDGDQGGDRCHALQVPNWSPRGRGAPVRGSRTMDGPENKNQNFRAIFGSILGGFSPEIDPGTPLRWTGRPPDMNLHLKSAPETNSKAISWWARGGYVLGRSHMRF